MRRGGGVYTYRPLWLDARFVSSSPIGCPRCHSRDLLSPLPAPFGVHAQGKQARNRLETVWSLSEIDKNWRWSFFCFFHCTSFLHNYKEASRVEIGNVLLSFPQTPSHTSLTSSAPQKKKYFFFLDKRCESFFLLQSIGRQLFMHSQVRQAPQRKLP